MIDPSAPRTDATSARSSSGDDEARGALAISLGQGLLMLSGGVLALLITQFFGKGAGTDAFFTAYGFYVIAVAFAQTLRLTALPRLMGDVTGSQESRLVTATLAMSLAAAVPMVALAGPIGRLIANGDPSGVAAQTLRLLWPALATQLLAGVLVPMLTLRGIFSSIGLAFALASFVSIAGFVLLQPELGIKAVSFGLTLSSAMLAASLLLTLRRTGWRFDAGTARHWRTILRDASALSVASASFLVLNLGYVIAMAVANHEARGSATTYAYAFFGAAFFVAVTAVPSALVRAPRLLDAHGDRGLAGGEVLADFRLALVPLIPLIGGAATVASPLADAVSAKFFSADDAQRLATALIALTPWVLAVAVAIMVVLELLNRGGAGRLAWIALAHTVTLVPLTIAGQRVLGTTGIALGQSLAMCLATAWQMRLAFGDRWLPLARSLAAQALKAAAIGTVAFAPAFVAARFSSTVAVAVLLAVGLAVCAVAVGRWFAPEWRLLTSIARRGAT